MKNNFFLKEINKKFINKVETIGRKIERKLIIISFSIQKNVYFIQRLKYIMKKYHFDNIKKDYIKLCWKANIIYISKNDR